MNLKPEHILLLHQNGCSCNNWPQVKIEDPENTIPRIRNCVFKTDTENEIYIHNRVSSLEQEPSSEYYNVFDYGLYNSVFIGKLEISTSALVYQSLVSNSIIHHGVCIVNCGSITATDFSVNNILKLGQGREISIYPSITFEDCITQCYTKKYLVDEKRFVLNHLLPYSEIINTPKIRNVCLGSGASISSGSIVEDSILETDVKVKENSVVRRSILQNNSSVSSMSIVEDSLLCFSSTVEKNGTVSMSVLGPLSSVAKGEITSCLIGPSLKCHHSSLLISCIWPKGRGNIGYGAKIGSNHTGRAPDQEIHIGEGIFFGLGCLIKFPSDLTQAPYSMFAAGVIALPQRIEFPFSLIISGTGILNEIKVGWILYENMYMIYRNEQKYKQSILCRPDIIDMVKRSIKLLECIREEKEIYTEKDIIGLGKNIMTEETRKKAIAAYKRLTLYYGLYFLLGEECSEHMRQQYNEEVIALGNPNKVLISLLKENLRLVIQSKEKDNIRGTKIISDYYIDKEDEVITTLQMETDRLVEKLKIIN